MQDTFVRRRQRLSRGFLAGLLLRPREGLLTDVCASLFAGEVRDVTLVPVTISYDRVLEDQSFIKEMMGSEKEPEVRSKSRVQGAESPTRTEVVASRLLDGP